MLLLPFNILQTRDRPEFSSCKGLTLRLARLLYIGLPYLQRRGYSARLGLPSRCIMNPKARIEHRRMPKQVLPIEGLLPLA